MRHEHLGVPHALAVYPRALGEERRRSKSSADSPASAAREATRANWPGKACARSTTSVLLGASAGWATSKANPVPR